MSLKEPFTKQIDHLINIRDLFGNDIGKPGIKIYDRANNTCRKYLKPNRREFYQIIFFEKGDGLFTLGLNTYRINEPTIAFIHPNEIISWENTGSESLGHICLFTKDFIEAHTMLKPIMEKYGLFTDISKSIIHVHEQDSTALKELFLKMHQEETAYTAQSGDVIQAYIQLIILTASKRAQSLVTVPANNEYRHVYDFFQLLEKTFSTNHNNPLKLRTAREFADELSVHPNHLNALVKRYTGENLSTHIKKRLLEESKVLLIQTNWTLERIANIAGFTAQPSFSQFFKKNLGITPGNYRKNFAINKQYMAKD